MEYQVRHIYIAGCGRSGTTLMMRLFRTFRSTYVHRTESPFSIFDHLSAKQDFIVVKRNAMARKYLHKIKPDIYIVYMIRHPYDVLTSFHPKFSTDQFYISPERWKSEYESLRRLQAARPDGERLHLLRYEDLVTRPDQEQLRIAAATGQEIKATFSKRGRISQASIGKFRSNENYRQYLEQNAGSIENELRQFCSDFGYGLGTSGAVIESESESVLQ